MEIATYSTHRVSGYGPAPATPARRPVTAPGAMDALDAQRVRTHVPVEYVVQGEVLEKHRTQESIDDLLESMRRMERELFLNVRAESQFRGNAYAWGAIAAYQHTAISTAAVLQPGSAQSVDYYV